MSHTLITCATAARILSDGVGRRIRTERVAGWLATGLLRDYGTPAAPRLRIDHNEVLTLASTLTYFPGQAPHPAYRVSVTALRQDPITIQQNGSNTLWRSHAGIDYRGQLPQLMALRAVTGVWPASHQTANDLAQRKAWLLPSDRGVILPGFVRIITGWEALGGNGRVAFETTSPSPALLAWIGTGLLIDIPQGAISGPA